jgi:hypothetical protein
MNAYIHDEYGTSSLHQALSSDGHWYEELSNSILHISPVFASYQLLEEMRTNNRGRPANLPQIEHRIADCEK